jgi:hypothetical protein
MVNIGLKVEKSSIEDGLFISSVTIGIVLLLGGLFTLYLSTCIPARVSGVESMVQNIVTIISLVPGAPVSFSDLANSGLVMVGLVSWIIGLNNLLIGLGLWAKNRIAKIVALGIFTLATIVNIIIFILNGVLGAPYAIIGIITNLTFVILLKKLTFN